MKKFIFFVSALPFTLSPSFICIKNESEQILQIDKSRLDKFSQYISVRKVTAEGDIQLLGDMPRLEQDAQLLLEIKDSIVADLKIPFGQGIKITPIVHVKLNIWVMAGRHTGFARTKRLPEEGELIYELEYEGQLDYFYRAWFMIRPNHIIKEWSSSLHNRYGSSENTEKKEWAHALSNRTSQIELLMPSPTKK